jgi:formimidoylglutamate deiminase
MPTEPRPQAAFWAPLAWTGYWQRDVLLEVGADGCWQRIDAGVAAPPQALVLEGPVLPGLVDAHSHAFQRAFAGLAERRDSVADDFWSWRDRMYGVALRIDPAQLQAIAAQLYVELLRGGYTQVCEFHYLQRDLDGQAYDDPLALAWSLAAAAQQAGVGLTMLPTLYQRAGFQDPALRDDQHRFASTPASVAHACRELRASGRPLLNAGIAIHSLRAAAPQAIENLLRALGDEDVPVHIHVAEQTAEVDDCVAATGVRPIEWLSRHGPLDARWQLVHATHATPAEIDAVAASGAGIVLCPGTEGNLGDGFADLRRWLATGTPIALGSDSQVTRAWPEELRWLEYGQRLLHRQRNVAAAPETQPASAQRLFALACHAGARAAGLPDWGLKRGARADLLVLDARDPALSGLPAEHALDALVFSSPNEAIRDVYVAGRCVLRDRRHAAQLSIAEAFESAMRTLWHAG